MTRKITTVLAGALLLVLATGSVVAQEDSQAMKDAVKELRDDYFVTYQQNDPETAASLFAADGVLLPPATAAIRGPEEVSERLAEFFDKQEVSMGAISEETLVVGERVLDRGFLTVEITPAGADESSSDTGKYVLLAEKVTPEEGGEERWRIRWLMWNTDNPLRSADGGDGEG